MKPPVAARKLRETEFFLQHIEETARGPAPKGEPEEPLRFYLSAFLSAAKSVIEITKWEQHGRSYREWEAALSSKDRDLIRFVGVQRNAEVHREGARMEPRTVRRIQYFIPAVRALKFADLEGDEIRYGPKGQGNLPKWITVTRHGVEHRFNINGQRLRVVAACRRCVILLRSLLRSIEETENVVR